MFIHESIRKICNDDALNLSGDMNFMDIQQWDSLNTVDLELEIESELGVEFDAGEFQNLKTIQSVIASVSEKLSKT